MSTNTRLIPLNKLKRSPHNVRITPHTPQEIKTLATSIDKNGLLQNLVVMPEVTTRGQRTGCYLVNIGEGRRLAYLFLVKQKKMKRDAPVRCMLDTKHNGREISLSENVIRTAMHPADQFIAFRNLIDEGQPIDDVAAKFGVSRLVVSQRLKLANVHPSFIELYRAGSVTLQHLTALAVTEDHERQQHAWNSLSTHEQKNPDALRRALTEGEISAREPMAKFVGVPAYTQAGGSVRRDLFREQDEFVTDSALLQRLAVEKLQRHAEALKAKEGLAWVETALQFDYADRAAFRDVTTITREPTDAEQQQATRFEQQRTRLMTAMANAKDDARLQQLQKKIDALYAERAEARRALTVVHPEQAPLTGAMVSIDHKGKLEIVRGLLRADDARRFARLEKARAAQASPRTHSESMMLQLTAHRTLALQAVLAQRVDVALVSLAHSLLLQSFFDGDGGQSCSALNITMDDKPPTAFAADLREAKAWTTLEAQREAIRQRLPQAGELFGWLLTQSQAEVLSLLAFCAATTVSTLQRHDGTSAGDALARTVELDMKEWWTPTAQGYFNSLPKERILAVVREAVSPSTEMTLIKLKKAPLAEAAAMQVAKTGWLPEPLRMAAA